MEELLRRIESGMTTAADAERLRRVLDRMWARRMDFDRQRLQERNETIKLAIQLASAAMLDAICILEAD